MMPSRNAIRFAISSLIPTAALGLAIATPSALAQEDNRASTLEEVIVTAQRREESLQDAPISLAALNYGRLEAMGFTNLSDLQSSVPNLSMREMPSSKTAVRNFIRGVGNNDAQLTQDPAVGVYLDGIYIARSTGLIMDLADVERVEVLRGPQGTLYGRNATGGAINIVSQKPKGEWGFKQKVTLGNYDAWRSETTIDLPEWANISTKFTYVRGAADGWVDNHGAGVDPNEEDRTAWRLALRFTPTENFTVDYSYDHSEMDYGTIYYQTINQPYAGSPYTALPWSHSRMEDFTPSEPFQESNFDIDGHGLTIEWALSDALTFKSLTGYRELNEHLYQDYSANPIIPRLFQNNPYDTDQDQFSQEFQLSGTMGRFDYIGGLYYFEENGEEVTTDYISLEVPPFLPFGAYLLQSRDTEATNEASAVYGQFSYRPGILDDRLKLTVGLRYSEDKREIDSSRLAALDFVTFDHAKASHKWDHLSGTAVVSYDIDDQQSAYLKFAQGYRTGGFNGRATRAEAVRTPIDEETVDSWELGYKSEWLDRRLRANIALYYMDYDDIQLSFAAVMDPSDVRFFNAGTAEIKGAELDLTAVPVEGLQLGIQYAYLDSEITDVINPFTNQPDNGKYVLPSAPENTFTATLDYALPSTAIGNPSLNLGYSWRDESAVSAAIYATPEGIIESYGLFNARFSLDAIPLVKTGDLSVAIWGRNLADEEYLVDAVGQFSWSDKTGAFGTPRTYGIDLLYQY